MKEKVFLPFTSFKSSSPELVEGAWALAWWAFRDKILVELTTGRRQRTEVEQTFRMVDSIFSFCEEVLFSRSKSRQKFVIRLEAAREWKKNPFPVIYNSIMWQNVNKGVVYDAALSCDFSVWCVMLSRCWQNNAWNMTMGGSHSPTGAIQIAISLLFWRYVYLAAPFMLRKSMRKQMRHIYILGTSTLEVPRFRRSKLTLLA